ncbi:alpha-L-fucosidase [Saccharicrinis fermentans]|uniref:alpha-L-fucosidase n=1 Tax=Saccharicrinis fermentans DSM 9555 = JCM 21142 TaxID=869213 RepID=W7YBY5_9BACT|nr:alpha-L-fucosidase [Saccharicrinis fermentans]GAF05962.1 alpha-L-fucosidase [Saccharicrinis fermentans DSM 9555 = JCM 21142]
MNRRNFLTSTLLAGAGAMILPGCLSNSKNNIPPYLASYNDLYKVDPRKASTEWFRNARYGMFIHYGLYSLLGRGEWVQLADKIHVNEYAKLADRFKADKFDADFITDLALQAEMKYINITTRHHDSFCLWDSQYTDFKSTNSPAKRDLVAELYEQCNKKGLALYLYYSHGRDWRHPHAPNNDNWGGNARPKYETKEPYYKYGEEHDINIYVDFLYNQVGELINMFPNIGGIWLDGQGVPASGDFAKFRLQELYDLVHAKQPHTLVSYKQGVLGTEDFLAPERKYKTEGLPEKPLEICDHLQRNKWGYAKNHDGKHKTKEEVIKMLKRASQYPANLLLNTGPLPSGQMHPEDVKVLREVGKEIKTRGWDNLWEHV